MSTRVVYSEHSGPLIGVRVTIYNIDTNTVITQQTTDSRGRYQLPDLEDGTYYVTFEHGSRKRYWYPSGNAL